MAIPTTGRPKLKTAFKKARTVPPLYTGGPVAVLPDGQRLVTCTGEELLLTEVSTGTQICTFAGDTQSVTSICVSPSSTHLLVFTSSLSLRIFELPRSLDSLEKPVQPIRVIAKAHEAPVHVCKTDPTSTYLASGSADGVVKVWDILRGYVTHVFKGHGGVVSALTFNYPQDPSVSQRTQMQLITASVDTRIRIFELSEASRATSKPGAVLEGHVSVPRGLDVSLDGKWLVSGGRDSVVLLWDLSSLSLVHSSAKRKGKGKETAPRLLKTIPILERVEAVGLLHDEDLTGTSSDPKNIRFFTGGENGVVKIWDAREGNVLFTLGTEHSQISADQEEQRQIVDVQYNAATSTLVSIHADQNILFHSLTSHSLTRQLIGYNDEIVDATFLSPLGVSKGSHLAIATNSSLVRVYSTSSLDARLLEGHKEIVLSVDHSADGSILASGSKDRSARIWAPSTSDEAYHCVGICEGHAESVGALAMSRKVDETDSPTKLRFMFTGSQDRTIKMWDLSSVPSTYAEGSDVVRCKSLLTLKAHEKDINSLDVAPNDRMLVSGSQDRTAKVYAIEYSGANGELKLLGTCKGHKRGVWSVKFGRAERVLATGSGDKTVKLWNLDDFSCVKTFEGHTNSVLRVDFLNFGMQLVSAGSDGLVKVWNVKEEECMVTLDNHEDKVWALAVSADDQTIVSGAADSVITFWQDNTQEEEEAKESKRADLVLKEQDFTNYISLKDYRRAIELALAMEQPGRLLSLFRDLRSSQDKTAGSVSGNASVDQVIRMLYGPDLAKLLRYIRDWNANAKTSAVAQGVLYIIVKLRSPEDVSKAFQVNFGQEDGKGSTALKELIDGLIPYTERHLSRTEKLVQESYMVDYILSEMDDGMFDGDEGSMDVDESLYV
ncbi:U3 small nucleolar RNA-associated protein [Armillaria mellea]|nr:U3 small nucleolar RNA-associated protein [Armillaria mellea]